MRGKLLLKLSIALIIAFFHCERLILPSFKQSNKTINPPTMSQTKKSDIHFAITLDDNNVPVDIKWQASDSSQVSRPTES